MAKSGRATEYERGLAPQLGWLNAIRAALPPEGIFVDELLNTFMSRFAFPTFGPRRFISTGYQDPDMDATARCRAHARAGRCDQRGWWRPFCDQRACNRRASQHSADNGDFQRSRLRQCQAPSDGQLWQPARCRPASAAPISRRLPIAGAGAHGVDPEDLRTALDIAIAHDGPSVIEVPVGNSSPWDFVLMPKVRRWVAPPFCCSLASSVLAV